MPTLPFQVVDQTDTNRYNQALQQAQTGVETTVHWFQPDVYFKIFLPTGTVSQQNLYMLAYQEGNNRRAMWGLPPVKVPSQYQVNPLPPGAGVEEG